MRSISCRVLKGSAAWARTLAAASRALIRLPDARGLLRVPFFGVVVFLRARHDLV